MAIKNLLNTALLIMTLALSAMPAMAVPTAQEYRNPAFDVKLLSTVLVLPIKMPRAFPEQKLAARLKRHWGDLIKSKRAEGGYAVLTPDQLLQKHYAAEGLRPLKWENDLQRVSYVGKIAPQYADAVLTMTITSCDYSSVNHPQRFTSGVEYEEVKRWDENGRITARREMVSERTLRPAWRERFVEAACRVELWSTLGNKQTLVYSCAAEERMSGAVYGDSLPSLEKVSAGLMEHAMRRVPVK